MNVQNKNWFVYNEAEALEVEPGIVRRVLACSDEMMCVEVSFRQGTVGAMHSHPHQQITYVLEGAFVFTIGDKTRRVCRGDSLLMENSIPHGCTCVETGKLLDIFHPPRLEYLT